MTHQITEKLKFNPHSINMLEQISEFLVRLVKDNPDFIETQIGDLVEVTINVLSEFVIGPCLENQRLMIDNRKIMSMLNVILEMSLNVNNRVNKKSVGMIIQILNESVIVPTCNIVLGELGDRQQRQGPAGTAARKHEPKESH
jgi:hypothetical protein